MYIRFFQLYPLCYCILDVIWQVVDMRWGVRDEATDDHMTTELCMNEIRNCQRLSTGPNFVVFLGQKYGYRPIPTIIDGESIQLLTVASHNVHVGAEKDVNLFHGENEYSYREISIV